MRTARLGIIGLGRMGRRHAENLRDKIPGAELVAVCSLVPDELEWAGRQLGVGVLTADYRELLGAGLDGLVIASSSSEHGRMICAAAEAGCRYVFSEKPIGMNPDEIVRIRAAAARRDFRLQVGYNRRFDASILAARQKIEAGFIGRLIQIRMINRDPAALADFIVKFSPASGGLVFDMLTHDYDLARWFTGSEAGTVYGLGGVYVYSGLEAAGDIDNCALLVEFENGVIGQFESSRNSAYGYHSETELYGSKGCIRIGNEPACDRVLYLDSSGIRRDGATWFYDYWKPTFLAELAHFVDCILEDRQPLVGLEDGCRAVEWAFAAAEAIKEKKTVRL